MAETINSQDCNGQCEDEECVCQKCSLTIPEFVLINESETKRLLFMRKHKLVPVYTRCPTCKSVLVCNDGEFFRCQKSYRDSNKLKRKCCFKQSIYKDTFFHRIILTTKEVFYFVMHWVGRDPPRQQFICDELGVSSSTVVDWSSYCREVLVDRAIAVSDVIGGPGIIVEIDEAKFGKRKYNKGRIIDGKWIFGGIERSNKAKCFYVPVPDRTKETLLGIIKKHILPGTIIMSDCWKAYNCLNDEGFQHLQVNHQMNFVDPETMAHTQNIERSWRDMRSRIVKYGSKEEHFSGYLAEYMFKSQVPVVKDRYHEFFKYAAKLYPGVEFE